MWKELYLVTCIVLLLIAACVGCGQAQAVPLAADDAAILDAPYIEAPATVSPAVAPPTPPVAVVALERDGNCPGGRCFDLPAKATRARSVQAPQRRVVFRGCGMFGRRCR